jgi:hypothetical protein
VALLHAQDNSAHAALQQQEVLMPTPKRLWQLPYLYEMKGDAASIA